MQQLNKFFGSYLTEKAILNSNIWSLDADLADSDGAEIFSISLPERFIACGIAEQNMVSIAAGLASVNVLPFAFSFAAFICFRAYDQIRTGISQTNLPVTLVGSHSGGCGGRNGKTHLALNDVALMASLPNMQVWAPADNNDVQIAIDMTLKIKTPTYIRLPREPVALIPRGESYIRWIGRPTKVALISYGLSTHWSLEAQTILENAGYEVGILHFCKVWPIDKNRISAFLKDVQFAFVVEDHYAYGGLGACLKLLDIKAEIIHWTWPSAWTGQSGDMPSLLSYCGLSPSILAKKVIEYLKK